MRQQAPREKEDTIATGFRCLTIAAASLEMLLGIEQLDRSMLLRGISFSTHFSGIGSIEIGASMINATCQSLWGRGCFEHTWYFCFQTWLLAGPIAALTP
jgi:hypothetical protein